jgi:hypothetical protein
MQARLDREHMRRDPFQRLLREAPIHKARSTIHRPSTAPSTAPSGRRSIFRRSEGLPRMS